MATPTKAIHDMATPMETNNNRNTNNRLVHIFNRINSSIGHYRQIKKRYTVSSASINKRPNIDCDLEDDEKIRFNPLYSAEKQVSVPIITRAKQPTMGVNAYSIKIKRNKAVDEQHIKTGFVQRRLTLSNTKSSYYTNQQQLCMPQYGSYNNNNNNSDNNSEETNFYFAQNNLYDAVDEFCKEDTFKSRKVYAQSTSVLRT